MRSLANLRAITLIELMLVTVIIAILAALAVPNLLRSRMFAREAISANVLRIICAAEVQWRATNPRYAKLEEMATARPPYIDVSLASGLKQGYNIAVFPNAGLDFYATATPQNLAHSNTYYIDEDGFLCRSNSVNTPTPDSHTAAGCPAGFSEVE